MAEKSVGKVVEVKGVVVDAVFAGELPRINNALAIKIPGGDGASDGCQTERQDTAEQAELRLPSE